MARKDACNYGLGEISSTQEDFVGLGIPWFMTHSGKGIDAAFVIPIDGSFLGFDTSRRSFVTFMRRFIILSDFKFMNLKIFYFTSSAQCGLNLSEGCIEHQVLYPTTGSKFASETAEGKDQEMEPGMDKPSRGCSRVRA